MKAISLWQPWASLWCSPRKVHETRHWRCSHRGWLLVHAAKRFEKGFELDDPLRSILDDEFGRHWARDPPTGALIGRVNVVDCLPTQALRGDAAASDDDRECGDFGPDRFAWKRDEFRLFDKSIRYRGAQGFFNVPDHLLWASTTIPMISDLDIWRAANLIIRQHGDDAELAAARRADLMLERGDLEGQTVWKRIRRAIVELQAPPTVPAH